MLSDAVNVFIVVSVIYLWVSFGPVSAEVNRDIVALNIHATAWWQQLHWNSTSYSFYARLCQFSRRKLRCCSDSLMNDRHRCDAMPSASVVTFTAKDANRRSWKNEVHCKNVNEEIHSMRLSTSQELKKMKRERKKTLVVATKILHERIQWFSLWDYGRASLNLKMSSFRVFRYWEAPP